MWETWVQSLGWEDPLEKGKATHSNILAWRIPRTLQSMRLQRVEWVYHILKFIHLLMDIYFASTFWLLRIVKLWTWVYKYRCEKNPRSGIPESYGNTISDFFFFWETAMVFSTGLYRFTFPSSIHKVNTVFYLYFKSINSEYLLYTSQVVGWHHRLNGHELK